MLRSIEATPAVGIAEDREGRSRNEAKVHVPVRFPGGPWPFWRPVQMVLCYYLQQHGILVDLYKAFVAGVQDDPMG